MRVSLWGEFGSEVGDGDQGLGFRVRGWERGSNRVASGRGRGRAAMVGSAWGGWVGNLFRLEAEGRLPLWPADAKSLQVRLQPIHVQLRPAACMRICERVADVLGGAVVYVACAARLIGAVSGQC